jgi:hypothetical protein
MLSLLNPSWLWALPVAAAPVLLHLIFLSRARRVLFSDLALLRAAYAKSLPSTRVRQWLLLALRTLTLACLVLSFSRPVLHRSRSGAEPQEGMRSEQGLDMVLLVDDSWSMGAVVRGKPRFDWACTAGHELIGVLRPADRVAVAAFSDRLEGALAWAGGRGPAAETLSRFRLGSRVSDLAGPLAAAYAFLSREKSARRRVVALLSDNARHLLRGLPQEDLSRLPGYDPDVALLGLAWDDPVDNAGIAELRLAEEPGPGGTPVLAARVSTVGPGRPDWQVSLWMGDKRVDSRSIELSPGLGPPRLYPLPPSPSPERWGRLGLRSDRLAADDDLYYAMRVNPKPRVLLAYGSPSYLEAGRGGYAFKKLLEGAQGLPYVFDMTELGRLEGLRLEDFDALMLDECRTLPGPAAEAIKRYVLRGGGLWIIAGTRAGPETFKALQDLLPASLGAMGSYHGGASSLVPDSGLPPQEGRFSWDEFELRNVSLGRRYDVELRPGSQVWFRDALGAPLMSCGTFGHGRVLLWASAIDVAWTNLALKPVFTAWTDVALRHLSGTSDRAQWRALKVGEPITRRWLAGEQAPARVQVRAPGGRSTVLMVEERGISFPDTRDPGVYFLAPLAGSEAAGAEAYAVNLDRTGSEGDWTPIRKPPWSALRPEALREDFLRSVYGREVRAFLLGLAGFLLALESLLSRPRVLLLLLALSSPSVSFAQDGDKFVWSQVRYTGAWDPYPGVHRDVLDFVTAVTSVLVLPERREVDLSDPRLFSVPFLVLGGKQAPPDLPEVEVGRLRDYLSSGGFLWIDDASGTAASSFDKWVRRTLAAALPDSELKPLSPDHVVFRTFFLMRKPGGRVLVSGSVEGVDWGGKTVVVYTRNDLLGAWAKDPLGRELYECSPGGDAQRMQAKKMTLNIVLFALTGTYKTDAVHQPYILEKMRMGQP